MGLKAHVSDFLFRFLQKSKNWCLGRRWQLRFLLYLYLFYLFVRNIPGFDNQGIFAPLNLCIHELGHLVFALFGNFICTLGGSFLQCLIPVIGIIMFYHQRDFFAISVALVWLATNFFGVANYIADARTMELPLVTLFGVTGPITHDWNYLLGKLGLLTMDIVIASFVRIIGFLTIAAGLIYGAWLLLLMYSYRKTQTTNVS